MHSVGSYEAKTHLPKLLERIAKGERIAITKHGVPVAVLVPPRLLVKPDPRAVIDKMRAFRKGRSLGKDSIHEMIKEGRRF